MSALSWISLAVFLVASIAGAVVVARRGLTTYRSARAFQRRLDGDLAPVLEGAAAMEARVAAASEAPVRIERAANGLRGSIAELTLLIEAFQEARVFYRVYKFVRS